MATGRLIIIALQTCTLTFYEPTIVSILSLDLSAIFAAERECLRFPAIFALCMLASNVAAPLRKKAE